MGEGGGRENFSQTESCVYLSLFTYAKDVQMKFLFEFVNIYLLRPQNIFSDAGNQNLFILA